jgi:thiol reductant ABC exporter CydD subunit
VKTLDPRLLRHARAARAYLAWTVALGIVTAGLVIAQAWLLADLIEASFLRHEALRQLAGPMAALLTVFVARASVLWATESASHRASARVKSQLRERLLARAVELGPAELAERGTADLATLATRGVDALDGYFSRYLPQLVLAVAVPTAVLAVVLGQDWVSALIIAGTIPLIPLFMIAIGVATRRRTDREFRSLQSLAGHFLDAVGGLPTLKVFGRAKAQAAVIREVTDAYRRTTMRTLRLAFLSSLVLEMLASVSVALVAVSVGLRLLSSHLSLRTALFVLLLTPEAYLPLRLVGANFHASAEGLAAAEQVFEVLDAPVPVPGARVDVPNAASTGIEIEDLTVSYRGRPAPALGSLTLSVRPGEILALTGPSGCGKSTLLAVLLGFARPQSGRVTIGGVDLADLDPVAWRAGIAWVPQRPHLFATTLEANIRLGRPDAPAAAVDAAVGAAGLTALVTRLPLGLDTALGEGGAGLSAGERQRVALARAFLRDAPLLLLDEPTAGLDGSTEAEVLESVRRLANGRTVLLVAHRPALVAMADRSFPLPSPAVPVLEVLPA